MTVALCVTTSFGMHGGPIDISMQELAARTIAEGAVGIGFGIKLFSGRTV